MITIFDKSIACRKATAQWPNVRIDPLDITDIPDNYLRQDKPRLPELSELEVVRHYTKLSQQNFSIDTNCYPLGSCTMKYNPRGVHKIAMLSGFLERHPLADEAHSQGIMACLYELQEYLKIITGMTAVSLTPMAGAQGEFAGVAMIRLYHQKRNDSARTEILVPDAAHGTNPASAAMCGFTVKIIPTNSEGDIDLEFLKTVLGLQTAGIMLTNPSTLGVFDRNIQEVARLVHAAGGLLYYDGANLNAILGKIRPGDMGFDVMHMNLHKTFATPHGGGGPGSGPVAVDDKLAAYLPVPMVDKQDGKYIWLTDKDCPDTIGRLSAFMGNTGILLRAYVYIRLLGELGLQRVSLHATLNANYLMKRLAQVGYQLAFPTRRASHEFIVTLKNEAAVYGVTALDLAKRLLDYQFYAPTIYFPLLISECILIEPTETESKQMLDLLVNVLTKIREEIKVAPEKCKNAPVSMSVGRLDEVKAVKDLALVYQP